MHHVLHSGCIECTGDVLSLRGDFCEEARDLADQDGFELNPEPEQQPTKIALVPAVSIELTVLLQWREFHLQLDNLPRGRR